MLKNTETISERYQRITMQISELSKESPLASHPVNLIAVSKRQSQERIDTLLALGQRHFGENRYQEGVEHWHQRKQAHPDCVLHFLGPLQTNKVKDVVGFFDVIHSVDRPKLAHALAAEMHKQNHQIPCFIQINTGEEPQKAGILPHDAPAFIQLCREELQLPVTGLMCLPPADVNPAPHFAFLRKLAQEHQIERLSMGMSGDWQTAIRMGATDIRLGTALFGERNE